jgi:hypothetical protein
VPQAGHPLRQAGGELPRLLGDCAHYALAIAARYAHRP